MAEHRSDRWPAVFRTAKEPLFLLDGRRRVRHVNRAWEELTGFTLAEVRGQQCKRLARPESAEAWQPALAAMAPPAEVLEGRPGSTRRRTTFGKGPAWWDIDFFPLRGEDRLVAILGKITVSPAGDPADLSIPDTLVQLRQSFVNRFDLGHLVSAEPAMIQVKEQARLAAQIDVPALLVGPTGSGKHWLARAIHQSSNRRDLACACLDCRKLPSTVLTQMLFGPRSQASGTLYFREPGYLPRELQVRLAQWLADTPSSDRPRILAGQRDAAAALQDAAPPVLPELLCQLGTLTIRLPALRERRADFDALLATLLARASAAHERTAPACEPEALQVLRNHSWPGNLRELYDVLLSACGRGTDRIGVDDLPFHVTQVPRPAERTLPLDALLEQVEKRLIQFALRQAGDNKTKAAELLGIWRARLIRRMQGLGLSSDDG